MQEGRWVGETMLECKRAMGWRECRAGWTCKTADSGGIEGEQVV